MAITMSSVFFIKFLLYVSLSLHLALKNSHAFYENQTTETQQSNLQYHTIQLSSLLPSSACKSASSQANHGNSSLKIIHKYGPCFQVNGENPRYPSLREILRQDQSRVNGIHSRLAGKISARGGTKDSKATNLPAHDGKSYDTGNYVVTVGLGTPKKDLSLVFDTGSFLTWTQCEPCVGSCYQQKEPKLDPATSQTYANVSCTASECNSHISGRDSPSCDSSNSTCLYEVKYGDQSYSTGFLARETLTLTPTDVIPDFLFGCGQQNEGLFGNAAGLLGLSQDPSSLVLQTAQKYNKIFSYCLPSTPSSTGYLTFGSSGAVPSSIKYTPLSSSDSRRSSFYGIDIIGLTVGGQKLQIDSSVFSTGGAIIDSGTVITRLPPDAYSALKSAFDKMMTKYPKAPPVDLLDTCYDASGLSSPSGLPRISFIFGGDVEVEIDPSGILVPASESTMCLAFAGSDITIIGNTQQKRLQVLYDAAEGRIGFAPAGCD